MAAAVEDTPWFKVLLALRWPVAVVSSSAVLGGVLLHVLSRPIPIRLAMPLDQPLPITAQVDQLARPIKVEQIARTINIDLNDAIQVRGTMGIDAARPIPISGQPRVVVAQPVEVKAGSALPVQGKVDVKAEQPLPVKGEVEVVTPGPLNVNADVTVKTDEKPVDIEVRGGLRGIF
jgi:hypothetical protein